MNRHLAPDERVADDGHEEPVRPAARRELEPALCVGQDVAMPGVLDSTSTFPSGAPVARVNHMPGDLSFRTCGRGSAYCHATGKEQESRGNQCRIARHGIGEARKRAGSKL